ncbi:putative Quercetin 2,3-dioxygenase [Crenothrix polyspora]|uniref:Putative Quercetin 2,3-dioxygenase n=1 Tax=Crenothrix polyspora TaxID=360316 RepID=A0A1R4H169_9GAMM|nr:pirin family protein [Crenothrix polyspora]SJM89800.1 putative Quercetin 2,3-dioxygenase [Crenothrix polyspora]
MSTRSLQQIIQSIPTSDGGGVKLRRSLGQSQALRLDPFLMLDEFSSMNPDDYIAGFPDHPHRGFETVTYMLDGHMLHRDHLGNQGHLKSGGVQWMSAGRGIIHSEMPQQDSGRLRGFQLWVNLPASKKMKSAAYRDIQAEDIPVVDLPDGGQVKVIAGHAEIDGKITTGAIQGLSTELLFLDVRIRAGGQFTHPLVTSHNAFVYPYEGRCELGSMLEIRPLESQSVGVLTLGDGVEIHAGREGVAFLLLAAKPLREPVVQHGPFVMNTQEEIEQAIADYKNGQLV